MELLLNYQLVSSISLVIGLLFLLSILTFMIRRKDREGIWMLKFVIIIMIYPLVLLAFTIMIYPLVHLAFNHLLGN